MSAASVTPTAGICEDDDELRGLLRDALTKLGDELGDPGALEPAA